MRNKLVIGLLLVFVLSMTALAQDAPPAPELDGDIVVTGLNSPQGVYVDSDGTLWVIDSGAGGEEAIELPSYEEGGDPTAATFGETSRIIRVLEDGTQEVVATLPSIDIGADYIGGADLTIIDGVIYASVGSWHISGGEEPDLPMQGAIVSVTDGVVEVLADTWAYELENNPDGFDLESHPYHISAGADGLLYVADAAANALLTVDPATGEIATVAVFEGLPGVFPNPIYNNEMITDAVPTGVVVNEDGSAFVSLLSGGPFIPGTAKVMQVSAEGEVSDYATGLTMLTDLQIGPDGNLYAVSFGMFTEEGPVFNSGSVVRILEDGTSETVIEGLPFPTGMAFDADGNGYVLVNGMAIPEAGMLVYYEGLTAMEGTPLPAMEG